MSATSWASAPNCRQRSSSCSASASSVTPRRCGADCSGLNGHEADMSDPNSEGAPQDNESESKADETAVQPDQQEHGPDDPAQHGRHELQPHQPHPEIGELRPRGFLDMLRRGLTVFGTLAVLLCLLLGVAIATQVHQNSSGDSLDTARPADLLVLLDSLRQREATLSTEVAELQRTLNALQASGSSDQAAIQNAQSRLAPLALLVGPRGPPPPGG